MNFVRMLQSVDASQGTQEKRESFILIRDSGFVNQIYMDLLTQGYENRLLP
jgi:hypothetical protein